MSINAGKPNVPGRPDSPTPAYDDWVLSNPWLWSLLGLALTFGAFLWARLVGDAYSGGRFFFLLTGLLSAGGGLVLRLTSPRTFLARLPLPTQRGVLAFLLLAYAGLALGLTALVLCFFFHERVLGWRPGASIVMWFVFVPAATVALQTIVQRLRRRQPVSAGEESSFILIVSALVLFLASWALYRPDDPLDWDTMRLFFAAFAGAAMAASILPLLPLTARYALISGLIVLHFGGICTAVLSAPPFAWVVGQLWTRIYRPYLEFMYLNNAYHFYSPEPGPASHVWFRLIYTDDKNNEWRHWVKMPDVDDDGQPNYIAGLTYQRLLSFTENVSHSEAMPAIQAINADGQPDWADFYKRRVLHSHTKPVGPPTLGVPNIQPSLVVPFANINEIPLSQQYAVPTKNVKRVLESYARHVLRTPMPGLPDDKITERRVKVYRITHAIPFQENYRRGQDPRDPRLYRPVFLGEYDEQGNLVDDQEPFLYWLLPNLAVRPDQRNTPIISYSRRHAGDPKHWYDPVKKVWQESSPE